MSIITQPSNRTVREACAPRASSSTNSNRRPNRMSHLARLTVIARLSLLSSVIGVMRLYNVRAGVVPVRFR